MSTESQRQQKKTGEDTIIKKQNFSNKNHSIGNIIFKDKTLYGSEIIFDYNCEKIKEPSLSESDIDTKAVSILKDLGWKEHKEIRQQKTNISEIDDYIKSKTTKSERKGHADVYLLINDKLRVVIDNKKPNESVDDGINDACYYAHCLLGMNYDIRIAISYNGKECKLNVFDSDIYGWVPFLIDGKELSAFPSKELVEIIYRYKDINSIVITEDVETINIDTIIQDLKEIYRNVPFLQNDNQKTIDFTIAFLAIKSILEKHSTELNKNWKDLDVAEQKKLKEKIRTYVEDIRDNLENGYEEIFRIKEDPKGKIKAFDFLEVIKQFPNMPSQGEKGYLIQIFEKLNELPHLHSSRFDLFGVVYQSLMDKHTRKIFGQFFTPRHLIKTLIRLFYENEIEILLGEIKEQKVIEPKTICDPACGTGGFLIESFKYLASNTLDVDVIDLAKKSIYGFDIYPANAVRSRINMYLAGDGFSRIDALNSLREINDNDRFDYILTNPPFGKGDYVVNKDVISNKRKEVNFLIRVVKLLKPHGKALIVVPDGILEAPTLAPLRRWIVKNCEIEKIIGLPKHEFAPYTHEKTYVLFLKKRLKSIIDLSEVQYERIWMYIVDTDGYANSDKKFRTAKKDENGKWLHDELSLWRGKKGLFHVSILEENWKNKIQQTNEKYIDEWDNEIKGLKYGYIEMKSFFRDDYSYYPTVNKTKIMKILKEEKTIIPPKNIREIFENLDGESDDVPKKKLIDNFEEILNKKGIAYESYDDKFYDENKPITVKLLNLLPEKYLRPKKTETTDFKQFSLQNQKLFNGINEDLKILKTEIGKMIN